METLAAKKKAAKQQQPTAGSAAASGATSETDDDKPQPGTIRSDRLGPLEAASAAGHAMVAAVKAVRLKSDDPARPALEPLKPAVACAEDLGKIFRSAEQYVRLTFLSAGADAADRPGSPPPPTSGVNPIGGPFTFRPTINPAPKRPSSAAPVRSTVHAAVTAATTTQLASIASLPLAVPLGGESAPSHHTVAELGNLRHVRPLTAPLLVPVPTRPAPDPAADMLTTATFGWGGAPYGQPQQAPFVYHYPVAPLGMPTAAEPRTVAALPPAPSAAYAGPEAYTHRASDVEPLGSHPNGLSRVASYETPPQPPLAASATPSEPPQPLGMSTPSPTAAASSSGAPPNPAGDVPAAPAEPPAQHAIETVGAAAVLIIATIASPADVQRPSESVANPLPTPVSSASAAQPVQPPLPTTAVLLPASLSDPIAGSYDPFKDDAALRRLMQPPKRHETLFKSAKALTPGQRAILERREKNSHW
jgi:hypothetical protein